MPLAAVEISMPIDQREQIDAADHALRIAQARPDDLDNGHKKSQPWSRGNIEKAVLHLRTAGEPLANYRWQPRVAFVRPARISFSQPRSELPSEKDGGQHSSPDASFDVVTIDLSSDGAGILSYSCDKPLPPHVTLHIDETEFDCEVRWSTKIGGRVYRHGLAFRAVRGNLPTTD